MLESSFWILRHWDVKRPNRAVEELHQVAATRTERRLTGQVDFRREMRPIVFVDPGAFTSVSASAVFGLPRMSLDENRALHELAACRQEETFGKHSSHL